jgi:hypothetical protein
VPFFLLSLLILAYTLMMIVAMAVVLVSVGSVLRAEACAERQVDIPMLRSKTP